MVARGEIDLGIANMLEVVDGIETGKLQNDLRVIGSIYTLRIGFFSARTAASSTVADLKGKRVPAGYSAMRTLDKNSLAMLATAGLTLNDVKPVMVPNVLRGGDDFIAGANDMFMFSFGGPKVREADATVGGVRALEIIDTPEGLEASRKVFPYGYFIEVKPGPVYVGVEKPMKAYSMDYILFTNAKTKDDIVDKIIDTMVKNKPDLVAVAAGARRLLAGASIASTRMPYHPGALKYFQDNKLEAKAYSQKASAGATTVLPTRRSTSPPRRRSGSLPARRNSPPNRRRRPCSAANVLQALLVACVVLWVLDVPRQVFNVSFYTEQLLTVRLGLTLALAFVAETSRQPSAIDLGRRPRVGRDRHLHRLPLLPPGARSPGRWSPRWPRRWPGPSPPAGPRCALVRLALRHRLAAALRLHHRPLRGADL